jgi:hypothetical protein
MFRPSGLSVVVSGLCCLLLVAGCGGGGDQLETAEVTGKVTYKGEPLRIGSVLFTPVGGGPSAQANIDRNGNYTLGTYTETDGAVLGEHQVMIVAMTSPGGSGLPEDANKGDVAPVSLIPDIYADPQNSGLKAEVNAGGNVINFDLKEVPPPGKPRR